ncbi:MAG: IscS subfamily cysteine desulfurase [Gammaproteobacteria bacterium]|nr:IscS subfamily cysteine desulfurase [Gammaproteobacteria bacterium]
MYPMIYLDYAATTPVDPAVAEQMAACLTLDGTFGNPASTTHEFGWQAAKLVETARQQIADLINADPREIIFTSGATEADNLAIKGIANFYKDRGDHIITMRTEHHAVLDTCAFLEKQGFTITYLNPQPDGRLNLAELTAAITDKTILISIMHVNNETGVTQDLAAIGQIAKQHNVFFHTDAAQSIGKLVIDTQTLSVDLISISAHKIYAPKGIGALYVRRKPKVRLQPLIHGGGHEQGSRSGTLPTHQIVGLGSALAIAQQNLIAEQTKLKKLRDYLMRELSTIPQTAFNGNQDHCVPNILSVRFAGIDAEALMASCPELAFSAGSACTSASIVPSHVLQAMGISNEAANSTVRLSMGRFTTMAELEMAVKTIRKQVARLRDLLP